MKKNKLIIGSLLMFLVGCTAPNDSSSSVDNNKSYDIKVWCAEAAVELTNKQLNDFKKENSSLKVNFNVQAISEAEAANNMVTDVEAGADIFAFTQDQLARLVSAGALDPLTGNVAETIKQENDENSIKVASINDTLYAYPLTSDNGCFMYYDKRYVKESSVDSLESIIEDLKENKKLFSYQLATDGAWYNSGFFFATGCYSKWTINDKGIFTSYEDTYNSDNGIKALKGMSKLMNSGVWNNASSVGEFNSGSAVVVSGTWDYEAAKEILKDNLGITDLPSFTVDTETFHIGSFFGNKLIGVKPQSDATKAAVCQLIAKYLTSESKQSERFDVLSWGPSNKKVQESEKVKSNPALVALKLQEKYAKPQGQNPGDWWPLAASIGSSVLEVGDNATDSKYKEILSTYEAGLKSLINQ